MVKRTCLWLKNLPKLIADDTGTSRTASGLLADGAVPDAWPLIEQKRTTELRTHSRAQWG